MERTGIIPVIKLQDPADAVPLAKALLQGGIAAAEVTFRTAAAEEAIRNIASEVPEVLIGAGTVLTVENVQKAIDAGAQFIVAPGFNPRIVDYCIQKKIPVFPGISNPSQIEQGLERGLDVLKFFPAEASGGLKSLKAMSAAYGGVRFMPTGGINPQNLTDYLLFDKIVACGGSWMVKPEMIEAGDFEGITRMSEEAVRKALGFEMIHIGINEESEEKAKDAAFLFAALFGFPLKEGNKSWFASQGIEITKSPFRGAKGHIAIGTNKILMAMNYLEGKGFRFKEDSAVRKDGKLVAIYLETEVSGFALHLLQE
jgi:2-dehydro-3-deoxyphosphogluconate aldolase / (4S)-4-hydroxy-2-oxoglutarate aldolase